MSGAGLWLYIYWKTAPGREADALAAVRRFQSGALLPHEAARVLRRADAAGAAQVTLMETYAAPGGLPPERVQALVAQSADALAGWAEAGRHAEVFEAA